VAGALMAQIHATLHLRSLLPEPVTVDGATVGEALSALFAAKPQLRSYVLDDQGALRQHVCIFADGTRLAGADALTRDIRPDTDLYIMQALSGG